MKLIFACSLLVASILLIEAVSSSMQLYKNINVIQTVDATKRSDFNWEDCTDPKDPAKLLNFSADPSSPVKGKYLKLKTDIDLEKEVKGGEIDIYLKGKFPYKQEVDLCSTIKKAGGSCPLEPGKQTIFLALPIPRFAPEGHYTGHSYMKDKSGAELICIKLDFMLH